MAVPMPNCDNCGSLVPEELFMQYIFSFPTGEYAEFCSLNCYNNSVPMLLKYVMDSQNSPATPRSRRA